MGGYRRNLWLPIKREGADGGSGCGSLFSISGLRFAGTGFHPLHTSKRSCGPLARRHGPAPFVT